MDKNVTDATGAISKAATRLDDLLKNIEPGLTRMTRESTDELQRLLGEARRLISNLTRLTQKMESDPRRFLFGNSVPEFTTP